MIVLAPIPPRESRIQNESDLTLTAERALDQSHPSSGWGGAQMPKDAIPQGLLIDGDNPLLLLHAALSGGLHAKTDEECLGFAHDTRIVLVELAECLDQTMKDEAELNAAVKRLRKV